MVLNSMQPDGTQAAAKNETGGDSMRKVLFTLTVVALVLGVAGEASSYHEWGSFPAKRPNLDDEYGPRTGFRNTGFDPNNDTVDLFFNAASAGDLGALNQMLDQNAQLVFAQSTKDGKTALHIACMVGKYDAAKVLLERGANPNVGDFYNKTPYYYARVAYDYNICRLLRRHGAMYEYIKFFPHYYWWQSPWPRVNCNKYPPI